MSHRTR